MSVISSVLLSGRITLSSLAATLALAVLAVAPGAAVAHSSGLLLETAGMPVASGSPAYAKARLGPCGTITAAGTLTSNGKPNDKASFTASGSTGGGCGEGGRSFSGRITGARASRTGTLSLLGEITYITGLPFCTYRMKKLEGPLTIPGETEATLSGSGTREGSAAAGCATHMTLEGVDAELGPTEGSAFEAVLG
jgi:hypothetical protein